MMQDRLGPNRAEVTIPGLGWTLRLWGITHFVADAIKMAFKEDLVPSKVDRLLYGLAPIMAIAPVLITFAIIPFGSDLCVGHVTDVISPGSLPGDHFAAGGAARHRLAVLLRAGVAGRLRHDARRLVVVQQVVAARWSARFVADDVVRSDDGPVADGRLPCTTARWNLTRW